MAREKISFQHYLLSILPGISLLAQLDLYVRHSEELRAGLGSAALHRGVELKLYKTSLKLGKF